VGARFSESSCTRVGRPVVIACHLNGETCNEVAPGNGLFGLAPFKQPLMKPTANCPRRLRYRDLRHQRRRNIQLLLGGLQ